MTGPVVTGPQSLRQPALQARQGRGSCLTDASTPQTAIRWRDDLVVQHDGLKNIHHFRMGLIDRAIAGGIE